MQFSVTREVLMRPVQQVAGVVERRQVMPVLANLLVEAEDGCVRLTGTDLEVELVAECQAEVQQRGQVTVPARKLADICRALPDGAVLKAQLQGDRMTIVAGRSRFTLATLPAEDFPLQDGVEFSDRVSLGRDALVEILERAAFAMAQQDVRFYLNGLLLELRPGFMRGVATDGHRLALCDVPIDIEVLDRRQMILPRKGVLELQRLLSDVAGEVTVEYGKNHARVVLSAGRFTSKLIDGRFPDYETVIPVCGERKAEVDRLEFREALQRVAILSSEKYRGVRLDVTNGQLRLTAHNPEQEEAVESIGIEGQLEGLNVGFNVTYLAEALGALRGKIVVLAVRDSGSSALLKEVDDDRCRQVIMPLKL